MNQLLVLLEQLLELDDVDEHELLDELLEVDEQLEELDELDVELLEVEQLDDELLELLEVELDDVEQLELHDELDDEQVDTIVDTEIVPPCVTVIPLLKSVNIAVMSAADSVTSDQSKEPMVVIAVDSALVPMLWYAG